MADETKSKGNTISSYIVKIIEYFLKHPAIGGSFIYIVLSGLGVIYSWNLYRNFGIIIFDYAEVNDFLLIVFKRVDIFVATVKVIVISVCILFCIIIINKYEHKVLKLTKVFSWICILFVIFVPFLVLHLYFFSAEATALKIKHGESAITVLYEKGKQASSSVVKELKSSLIGSTNKFMIFYDHSEARTVVVPISRIISITTIKQQHKIMTGKTTNARTNKTTR